jgi:hypothetical protein
MANPLHSASQTWLRKLDLLTGIIIALFGLIVLLVTLSFRWDLPSVRQAGWYTAPGIVPAGVAIILILQGVGLTIQALRRGGTWQRGDLARVKETLASPAARRSALVASLLLVYVFGMVGRIHFTISSFLFLAAFMFIFRAGAWWKIVLISSLASGAISFVFEGVARVPLP